MTREESEALRRAKAEIGQFIRTQHCRERMAERNAGPEDVKRAVATANAAELKPNGTWRLRGGVDVEGDALDVVVDLEVGKIVTVM